MQHVELRDYCGDYEDVAQFWDRVWIPEDGGKMWVTAGDAAFFRWLVCAQSGALCPVAYDGTKLVGSLTRRLEGSACGTLVFERDGSIEGW
jgi:hypothetical protein